MLLHLSLVIEILSIIVCIHCIYGEKVKLDPLTVVSFLGILIWLEIVNYYDLNRACTCISYILFGIYCKKKFGKALIHTLINVCLFFVILLILQFLGLVVAGILFPGLVELQSVVGALITFVICVFILPKFKLYRLSKIMQKRSKIVLGVVGFVLIFILIMNIQNKVKFGIQVELYLLMIPMIVGILVLVYKWCFSQEKVERIEKEIRVVEKSKDKYDELLKSMRLKQHGFRNQLAAILSAQYTHDTYEKIIRAQNQYYGQITNENKHYRLLFLGDYIIAGFLYEKIIEAEADGILVEYNLTSKIENYKMPAYYLVEIVGILFDNAVEAIKEAKDNRVIVIEITETETGYVFSISNPFRYVPYEELTEWFKKDKSNKGIGRGLGLYHVKYLCEQFDCTIGCRNVEENHVNWIKFILDIQKADNT